MSWTELLESCDLGFLGNTDGIEPQTDRQVVLTVGMKGLDAINYAFKIRNTLDCAEWLLDVKAITEEQLESIKKMCASEDKENAELAITIIEQKKHEYNLQRGGSQL
jgi:hypothetical protein